MRKERVRQASERASQGLFLRGCEGSCMFVCFYNDIIGQLDWEPLLLKHPAQPADNKLCTTPKTWWWDMPSLVCYKVFLKVVFYCLSFIHWQETKNSWKVYLRRTQLVRDDQAMAGTLQMIYLDILGRGKKIRVLCISLALYFRVAMLVLIIIIIIIYCKSYLKAKRKWVHLFNNVSGNPKRFMANTKKTRCTNTFF